MNTRVMVVASALLAVVALPYIVSAEPTSEQADTATTEEKTEAPTTESAPAVPSSPTPPKPASVPAAPKVAQPGADASSPPVKAPPAAAPTKVVPAAPVTEAPSLPAKKASPTPEKTASTGAKVASDMAVSSDAPTILTEDTVIATWVEDNQPKQLTYKELKDARKATFRRLEQEQHNTIKRELEGYMLDKLLQKDASTQDKTMDEYVKSLADGVAAEEVKKFYETNVSKDGKSPPFETVEPRIRQYLAMKDTTARIREAASLKLSVPEPNIPPVHFNVGDRPRKGPENAKLTLVEFSDFQCPYCSRAVGPLNEILKEFPNDVAVYFFHFPLDFHKKAKPAAIASRCAQKQGKFWEMHDLIFENQSKIDAEDLKSYATTLKLDLAKYETCIKDPAVAKFVEDDIVQGSEAGVGGTPSFFVNGRALERPPTVESIRSML